MATKTVTWTSTTRLGCEIGDTVILCLREGLVISKICPEQEENQPYEYSTIEAVLLSATLFGQYQSPQWSYIFSYNNTQLILASITESDILAASCRDCFVKWAEERIGDEAHIKEEDSIPILVSEHGCEYPIGSGAGGLDFVFGNGPDGDFLVENGEQLILPTGRNYFFENMTIEEGGSFIPIGDTGERLNLLGEGNGLVYPERFIIFVSDTLTINGTFFGDGEAGDNGMGAFILEDPCSSSGPIYYHGAKGGRKITLIVLGNNDYAGDGFGGTDDTGGCGGAGESDAGAAENGRFNYGWVGNYNAMGGGHGGAGGGGTGGGVGGVGSFENKNFGSPRKLERFVFSAITFSVDDSEVCTAIGGGAAGAGGGGGGRTGNAQGGMGGGGGAGGGSFYIYANRIVIGPNGRISARGGNGGNGAAATAGDPGDTAGGGGGGGAGGGGLVYLVYQNLVNYGTIDVSKGIGGSGGASVGGPDPGEDGADGEDGNIYLLNICSGKFETIEEVTP